MPQIKFVGITIFLYFICNISFAEEAMGVSNNPDPFIRQSEALYQALELALTNRIKITDQENVVTDETNDGTQYETISWGKFYFKISQYILSGNKLSVIIDYDDEIKQKSDSEIIYSFSYEMTRNEYGVVIKKSNLEILNKNDKLEKNESRTTIINEIDGENEIFSIQSGVTYLRKP